jgi:chromosome partitioning protein
MGKTIFIGSRKGGVGKTTTAASLGTGLAKHGKRVLLIDADSQHSLTVSLGLREPDRLLFTLASVMTRLINETDFDSTSELTRFAEGVDLLPASNTLAGIELALAPLIGRETVLRQYIDKVKPLYDLHYNRHFADARFTHHKRARGGGRRDYSRLPQILGRKRLGTLAQIRGANQTAN